MARGPVLGLAFLAAVASPATVACRKRGVGIGGDGTAKVTLSPNRLPMVTAGWPVSLPLRPLTFDATIRSHAASTTNSEARPVEAELSTTAGAAPIFQPIPNPIGAVVARHILGPNYLRTVRVTQSDEALAAMF